METTYLGHGGFYFKHPSIRFMVDPFLSGLETGLNYADYPADVVLLTHGHNDHIADAAHVQKLQGAEVWAPYEVALWLEKQGVEKVSPWNIGAIKPLGEGSVKVVPAAHSSSLPDGTYGGAATGFLFRFNSKTIYFAGDTALTSEMEFLAKYHQIDLAFLPIGNTFTMGYEEAFQASKLLNCSRIIGMHFNTFESIQINTQKAQQLFEKNGVSLTLMEPGAEIAL